MLNVGCKSVVPSMESKAVLGYQKYFPKIVKSVHTNWSAAICSLMLRERVESVHSSLAYECVALSRMYLNSKLLLDK